MIKSKYIQYFFFNIRFIITVLLYLVLSGLLLFNKNILIVISQNIWKDIFIGIILGYILYLLMIIISKLLSRYLFINRLYQRALPKVYSNIGVKKMIILVPCVVLFEELLFRSVLLTIFLKSISMTSSILLISFIFSIVHFNSHKLFQLFIMGIYLSYLVLLSDGILCSIIAHATNNILAIYLININNGKN